MFKIDPEKHPRVKAKLQALLGAKFDLTKLAVFEAIANDSLPITSAGGIYKNARMTSDYLEAMSEKIQNNEFVPMIKLHDQHYSLPIGRIFDSANLESTAGEGENDLHILFYVDITAAPEIASTLENGSLAEISTGTTPSSLKCSACNYDFLASADNRRNLWAGKNYTPLCAEGHQWGVGGNHLKLAALSAWKETSAVTRGAVGRAHILNEKEMRLANQNEQINLAAHVDDDKLLLVTLQDGQKAPEFNGAVPTEQGNGNKNMTDISVPRDDYNKMVLSQGKATELEVQLTAATTAQTEAELAKKTAEEAKLAADEAKAAVDTELAAEKEKVVQLTAQLAAAKVPPGGASTPAGQEGGEGAPSAAFGLDASYFKVNG